jgi:integrase
VVTKRAGLTGVRLHDLRHTYASFGAGGGLGLPIIGRLLGHAQAATTARYAHLDNDPPAGRKQLLDVSQLHLRATQQPQFDPH